MDELREDIITIFTPVYNRAGLLPRLFDSLKHQTCQKFEWIAIDDGSTDNSLEVLQELRTGGGASFPITVIHTENGGKHRAFNRAVKEAHGEYFTCLDSDDYLTPQAVEHYHTWIQAIKKEPNYRYFAGVSGLRLHEDGSSFGGTGTGAEYVDASALEQSRYNLGGEKPSACKTSVLRTFPFAEFEGENFLTEYVGFLIALAGYKIRYYPVGIAIGEYLPDGLTRIGDTKNINSFDGFTFSSRLYLLLYYNRLRSRIFYTAYYAKVAEKKGLSVSEAAKRLGVSVLFMKFSKLVFRIYLGTAKPFISRMKRLFSR